MDWNYKSFSKSTYTGDMRLTGAYYDRLDSPGTAGQILSSTVNGTEWIPTPSGSGSDTDWTEDVNSVYNSTKNIGVAPILQQTLYMFMEQQQLLPLVLLTH